MGRDAASVDDGPVPFGELNLFADAACTPAPDGGAVLAQFGQPAAPDQIEAIAVRGATLIAGASSPTIVSLNNGQTTPSTASLFAVPTAGGAARTILAPSYIGNNFAFDESRIYFVASYDENTDTSTGISAQVLATGATTYISAPSVQAFAASAASGGVYWLDANDAVHFWNPETGSSHELASGGGFSDIAADDVSVYWTEIVGNPEVVTLASVPLAGGPVSTLASGIPTSGYSGIAGVTSTNVVFYGDSIWQVDKGGGTPVVVVTADSLPNGFVSTWADEASVYWISEPYQNQLFRAPLDGGTAQIVFDEPAIEQGQLVDYFITSVAFDACNVYVAAANDPSVYAVRK